MTPRALLLGLVFVVFIAWAVPYSDLVMQGTWVGLTAFPIASFFVFLLMATAGNAILRWMRQPLSSSELLLIFAMTLVSAGIPSFGMTALLIPYIAGPFYFANPENRYASLLHPYLPKWLAPRTREAVVWLYEGSPPGQPVPWGDWLVPLAVWTVLVAAVYLVFFSLSAILRRQWVDREKLVFPLVHLPVEMAKQARLSLTASTSFFRNRIMWWFFSLPFLIHTLNGLHFHFPAVPYVNVHLVYLDSYITKPPWSALSPLFLRLPFSIVGLVYLLPQELSFSLWFFYFFFLLQQLVVVGALGHPSRSVQAYPVHEFVAHQMIGGILAFALFGLWTMRAHLRDVFRQAFGPGRSLDDENEAMPYRGAVIALCVGLILICGWGAAAGAGFFSTLLIFALYFLAHLVAVRLVCEGGMLYVQHPFRPMNLILAALGSASLGPRRIAILNYFDHLFMLDNRSPLMPEIVQALKIADAGPLPRRKLAAALGLSVAVTLPVSYFSYLRLMYRHGGLALREWFTTYYTRNLYCSWTAHLISQGEPPQRAAFGLMAVGAATMVLLMTLHRNFLWWPFHPIGYLMGASWPMINYWFPIMLGWAVKGAILRWAGVRVYRQLIPGFLGFILAEFLSAGLWVLIDFAAGKPGHEIFSF